MSVNSILRPCRFFGPKIRFSQTGKSHFAIAFALLLAVAARAQEPFGSSPMESNPFGSADPSAAVEPSSPFGGVERPVGGEPAVELNNAATTNEVAEANPVVLMLRENPPETPVEMAKGLSWMMRFKRWDEVRRLLDSVIAKNWSLPELSELSKSGDPTLWLRLSVDEAGLNEAQRGIVESVLAAPSQLARDSAWLDKWIDRLAHPQAGERRLAQIKLLDGGEVAIQQLLQRLMSGDAKIDAGMLAGTVAEFGETGVGALRAACLVKDFERAERVLLGIAEIPEQTFSAELGAALSSSRLSEPARSELAQLLSRKYGKLPSAEEIREFLIKKFDSQFASYQTIRNSNRPELEVVWRQSADGKFIQPVKSRIAESRLQAAAQLAAHRMNLTIATTEDLVDCTAIVLQNAYQVDSALQTSELASIFMTSLDHVAAKDPGFWIRVFDRATELQLHAGAVRASQMLIQSAPGPHHVPLDFMERLLSDSRPILRYIALNKIAEIDPRQSFAGAEKTLEVALEMTRLGSGPHALVVGRHAEQRQAAQQQLQIQIGANVTSVDSARAALKALESPVPIELVLLVDRVADQSVYELLQRLRGSARGRDLPIAILTEELYQHERRLIAEMRGVVASILSSSPQQMQRVVDEMIAQLDTMPLTVGERIEFATVAAQFLARLAGDRETYAFYPVSDWRVELAEIGQGLETGPRLELLSGVGSSDSQLQLVSLASNAGTAGDDRWRAAVAFGKSVRRFGIKLGREDILRIYDLYNTLGPNDSATAKALGLALDVIEAHAGKKAWPEGL